MQAPRFREAFHNSPTCLKLGLASFDVTGDASDMLFMSDIHTGVDNALKEQIIQAATDNDMNNIGEQAIRASLDKLANLAHNFKRQRTREDQIMELYSPPAPSRNMPQTLELIAKAASHWRHFSPTKYQAETATTQKAIEDLVSSKWRSRLLTKLLPFIEHFTYMKQNQAADKWERWHMLFGVTRANTIKNHCLAFEQMLKFLESDPFPLTTDSAMHILSHHIHKKSTASRLRKAWKTLRWICKTFGHDDITSRQDLKNSYDHAIDKLNTSLYTTNKKAIMPTMRAIHALEKAANNDKLSKATQYAAATFRYQLGCSGRFNDLQHVAPHTFTEQSHTIEGFPWQTKTMNRNDSRQHKALICPKHSFTGIHWWLPLTTGAPVLAAHESQPDYLLPQPDRHFSALIPRPCQYHTALKWLRHILASNDCDPETTNSITLHSLRLWAAETAYLTNIDRDKRKYIGQWSHEATADIYTRDHRMMITGIWDEMTAKIHSDPTILPSALQLAPKDPLDKDYFVDADDRDEHIAPATPNINDLLPHTPLAAPAALLDVTSFPTDMGGPLTIMVNTKTTGKDRVRRIHFYTLGGRPIGCATKYNPITQDAIANDDDYVSCYLESEVCKHCARHARIPETWTDLAKATHSITAHKNLTAPSESSQSDDEASNDTASEKDTSLTL